MFLKTCGTTNRTFSNSQYFLFFEKEWMKINSVLYTSPCYVPDVSEINLPSHFVSFITVWITVCFCPVFHKILMNKCRMHQYGAVTETMNTWLTLRHWQLCCSEVLWGKFACMLADTWLIWSSYQWGEFASLIKRGMCMNRLF